MSPVTKLLERDRLEHEARCTCKVLSSAAGAIGKRIRHDCALHRQSLCAHTDCRWVEREAWWGQVRVRWCCNTCSFLFDELVTGKPMPTKPKAVVR